MSDTKESKQAEPEKRVSKSKAKDFTDLVDEKLPEYLGWVKADANKLNDAITELLVIEKKTRLAADIKSTQRVALAILEAAFEHKNWKVLNEQITGLSKKRAQLQTVVTSLVQEGVKYLEQAPDKPTRLELINTLRAVSEGKMYVELERARLTRMLSEIKEAEGDVTEACDVLQEVQVETIGSMELREKAEMLLEQMRLCLAKKDFVRAEIVSNKVNRKALSDDAALHDLKLKFYELLVQYHSHFNHYLEICKAYREVFLTPSVQEDKAKWAPALAKCVMFLALSPFDSEVSDMLHRLRDDKKAQQLPAVSEVLTQLTTDEIITWPLTVDAEWKADAVFAGDEGKARWDDLRKRVVQHNMRVIGGFYSRINTRRLAQLLGLDEETAESYLSEMVSSGQLFARMDRPAGVVSFVRRKDANDLLNAWSSDLNDLLSLVDKTCHMINKENMMHKIKSNVRA